MIPVIIPYYKKEYQLKKCISHLDNQTIPVEIFVRDNNEDNIYFTAAVNEGIRKYLDQNCKYLIILNQDMYLEPAAVEEMVKFMDAHPQCGIGTPLQLHPQNPDYVICAGSYEAFPFGKHQHGQLAEFAENELLFWGNGACMIFKKDMVQEIGLLDKNLVFLGSDSDYCFTARSRGWQVWRIARARGIHEHGGSGSTADLKLGILKLNDMIYFGKKWLTGDLYKKLAWDGNNFTPGKVAEVMNLLENSKMEKLVRAKNELEDG